MKKVLMVCLGNICRSPMAEGILRNKANNAGVDLEIDSAGTGNWHTNESPDERAQETTLKNGVNISSLRGRTFSTNDFDVFDEIYVMDESNYGNVLAKARTPEDEGKVKMILELTHPGENLSVPDPYFGGMGGFDNVYSLLDNACEVIIKNHQNV